MFNTLHPVGKQVSPTARGHTIGFVETQSECEALILALIQTALSEAQVTVFHGEEGIHVLENMLEGSLRGENAEEVVRQSAMELRVGHHVVCVEVQDSAEAATVADVSAQHGCHSIYYFGSLIDTRRTA